MIQELFKVNNVWSFFYTNGSSVNVSLKSGKLIGINCIDFALKWENSTKSTSGYFLYNSRLAFWSIGLNDTLAIDIDSGDIDQILPFGLRETFYGRLLISSFYNTKNGKTELGLFDFKESKQLWKSYDINFLIFKDGALFDVNFGNLLRIGIENGVAIWQTDLSTYGTIAQLLGTSNGVLWVYFQNYTLAGVDVATGQVVQQFNPFEALYQPGYYAFDFPWLDATANKIYFFERDSYLVTDLQNATTTVLWQKSGMRVKGNCFDKDYIYYIASPAHTIACTIIGVFNRHTLVIEDEFELPLTELNSLHTPKVAGNKIYSLDSAGTLHVFERTVDGKHNA